MLWKASKALLRQNLGSLQQNVGNWMAANCWSTIFQGLWTLLKSWGSGEQTKLWPNIVVLLFARESKYTYNIYIYIYMLVGGWATPLKNMSPSLGMMTFPTYGKIKNDPNHQPETDEILGKKWWILMNLMKSSLYIYMLSYVYIYVILIGGFKHVLFSISYMG